MILRSLTIRNFGLYSGENIFSFVGETEKENITVISGKNGVGKSTLQEALHLCLLGRLAKDNRISEQEYEKYLTSRCYDGMPEGETTELELQFDFYQSGIATDYKVIRSWTKGNKKFEEHIEIYVNGKPLPGLNKKEKNLYLRDIIQPGYAKIMFFDGEKLSSIYEGKSIASFLQEVCTYVFGLNFIETLDADLNQYISRLLLIENNTEILEELKKQEEELQRVQANELDCFKEAENVTQEIEVCRLKIQEKETELAKHGRWVTEKVESIRAERQATEAAIQQARKELVDIYSGIGTIVFCEDLSLALQTRLTREKEIERWLHAKELLEERSQIVLAHLKKYQKTTNERWDKLLADIQGILLVEPLALSPKNKIFLDFLTDADRSRLIAWISTAVYEVKKQIRDKSEFLITQERRLKELSKEQSAFSKEDTVQPILQELQILNKHIGALEQRLKTLNRTLEETKSKIHFYNTRVANIKSRSIPNQQINEKKEMSLRVKKVLETYTHELIAKKLQILAVNILRRFNELCGKVSFFDELAIDPSSFDLVFSHTGVKVDYRQLSAGEQQILIIAILWGLRDMTSLALPLIIDTPLARLDELHRKAFVKEFLGNVKDQVILIGTDMEITADIVEMISPKICYHYQLAYDSNTRATKINLSANSYAENQIA